jgi:hypothetical protein
MTKILLFEDDEINGAPAMRKTPATMTHRNHTSAAPHAAAGR